MNAKGLLAVPLLGFALAACSITIAPIAPTLGNLNVQTTWCSQQDTQVDMKVDLTGALTKVDVFFASKGTVASDVNALTPKVTINSLSLGDGRVSLSALLTAANGHLVPASKNAAGAYNPTAIVVDPVIQVYIRGYNDAAASNLLRANNPMNPDGTATCDPSPEKVQ